MEPSVNVLPFTLMIASILGYLFLSKSRSIIEARPMGAALYRGLQTASLLVLIALFSWQVFSMGFEMGGDVARRDARAETRALAP